jgi:hypothetical protein
LGAAIGLALLVLIANAATARRFPESGRWTTVRARQRLDERRRTLSDAPTGFPSPLPNSHTGIQGEQRRRDTNFLVSSARDGEIDEAGLRALAAHLQHRERCQVPKQHFTRMFAALDELLERSTDRSGHA